MNKPTLLLVLILGFGSASIAWKLANDQFEVTAIKARHRQIINAFASDDPLAIDAFIAPGHRTRSGTNFSWIEENGSSPDNDGWAVTIGRERAMVIPNRIFHFYVLPGGSGFEMIKVDQEWYLTGKISID